jgi:hypothetical protein
MKEAHLTAVIARTFTKRTIVFSRTKQQAHRLKIILALSGVKTAELHGGARRAGGRQPPRHFILCSQPQSHALYELCPCFFPFLWGLLLGRCHSHCTLPPYVLGRVYDDYEHLSRTSTENS